MLCGFTPSKRFDWLLENVIYSLIEEEAFWRKYNEEPDEKESLWIVNSANADVLVTRASLSVSDKLADILSDWLDIIESGADGEILLVKFAMIFSVTGKDEDKNFVWNLANDWKNTTVLRSHYP